MLNPSRAAIAGVKWSAISQFGRRILSLVTNIVLARLLAPSDFGLVAMAAVVLGFMEMFRDLGTGSAVVRHQDLSPTAISSVFWLNAAFGASTTIVLMLAAPLF